MADIKWPQGVAHAIDNFRRKLNKLEVEKQALEVELRLLEAKVSPPPSISQEPCILSNQEKVTVFRRLFRGREDVFPTRWDNSMTGKSGYALACGNEWIKGLCHKPQVKCSACKNKAFLPVTDKTIRCHLSGNDARGRPFCAGVYPMLKDETCWFLVADFDKSNWQADVTAFIQTCRNNDLPVYIERSRSGNGGHVWLFFLNQSQLRMGNPPIFNGVR